MGDDLHCLYLLFALIVGFPFGNLFIGSEVAVLRVVQGQEVVVMDIVEFDDSALVLLGDWRLFV
jgi:hypothetical protein